MITRLRLKNFKKHDLLDVSFTTGLNGIFGANYRGKSTILHGILFCLGGTSAVPGNTLQRNGTNTGFKQELWFTVKGDQYYIVRTKTQARLFAGNDDKGDLISAGTSPVNEAVANVLGMTMRRFQQLRYASQKKTDAMLTLGVTELSKIIEELSGADKIDTALSNLKTIVTYESGKIEGMQEVDVKHLELQLSELHTQSKELQIQKADQEAQLNDTQGVVKETQCQLSEFQKVAQEQNTLNIKLSSRDAERVATERQISELSEEFSRLSAPSLEVVTEMQNRLNKLSGWRDQFNAALEARSEAGRQEKTLRRALSNLIQPELTDTSYDKQQHDTCLAELSEAEASHQSLVRQIKVLNTKIKNGVCSECDRPYEDIDIPKLQQQREQLQEAARKTKAVADALDARCDTFDAARDSAIRSEALMSAHNQQRNQLEQDIGEAVEALELATSQYNEVVRCADRDEQSLEIEFQALLEEWNTAQNDRKQADVVEGKLVRLDRALSELNGIIDELKQQVVEIDTESVVMMQQALQQLQQQEGDQKAELERTNTTLEQLTQNVEKQTSYINEGRRANELVQKSKARLDGCKTLQKYLKSNRDRYMSDVWAGFMAQASAFVQACTGGAVEGLLRTSEGKFKFMENEFEMEMKSASGAQSSIMGLGVQMALADATACPIDVVLVDEPCADMDPEHSMATAAMLAANGRQVICVSHSQMDSSVCNNVIQL